MQKSRIINLSLGSSITLTVILLVALWDTIDQRQVLINHTSFALLWVATLAILVEVGPLQLWRIYLYCKMSGKPLTEERKVGDPQLKDEPEEDLYDG